MKNKLKIFEEKKVRSVWSEEKQKWFFSVIDIVAILTEQTDYKKANTCFIYMKNMIKYTIDNHNYLSINGYATDINNKKYQCDFFIDDN